MGCITLVRCVLVLRCGLVVVVWYPYAGFSLHTDTTPPQPHCRVTPTNIEPDTTHEVTQRISRQLLRMDVLRERGYFLLVSMQPPVPRMRGPFPWGNLTGEWNRSLTSIHYGG